MSVPTFDKEGNAFAPSGDTFHISGSILHPLQKAGVIGLRGTTWTFRGIGSSISDAISHFAKLPIAGSGEEIH